MKLESGSDKPRESGRKWLIISGNEFFFSARKGRTTATHGARRTIKLLLTPNAHGKIAADGEIDCYQRQSTI
ncbi:MAG TPA: hypothetical protein VF797_09680 [Noviherbaspirillum sp.]